MQTYEYILMAMSGGQLLAMIVGGYIFLSKPAEKATDKINIMSSNCILKHTRIDEVLREMKEQFSGINKSLLLIKENDIKHIENEMRRMSDVQTRILTIMEIKNQNKEV
jgi:hypothetical protein